MLGLLGAFLLRDLFNSLRIRINNTFEQNVIYDMRRDVYARLQRLPVDYFDQRASGDLMTRVIEDVNSVERVLIDGTEQGTRGGAGHRRRGGDHVLPPTRCWRPWRWFPCRCWRRRALVHPHGPPPLSRANARPPAP